MSEFAEVRDVLVRALEDRAGRWEHVKAFQELVFAQQSLGTDPVTESVLRDLAYDLDFYRHDATSNVRFEEEVRSALSRIKSTTSDR